MHIYGTETHTNMKLLKEQVGDVFFSLKTPWQISAVKWWLMTAQNILALLDCINLSILQNTE